MSQRDWQALLADTDRLVAQVEEETALHRDVTQLVQKHYGGQASRLKAETRHSTSYAVSWSAIAETATILPELEDAGLELIAQRLGYLPHHSRVQPQEAFIRALLNQHRAQPFPEAVFLAQVDEAIKCIRNADMEPDTAADYPAAAYARYETFLPHHREAARDRLAQFLGYPPPLRHSLAIELWLRQKLADDTLHLPAAVPTVIDQRAVTQVKYREVLVAHGKPVADASPLPGLIVPMRTAIK